MFNPLTWISTRHELSRASLPLLQVRIHVYSQLQHQLEVEQYSAVL